MNQYTIFCSSNAVNISLYIITDPDIFTGGDFKTECNILIAVYNSQNLTGCPIVDSPRLTDGVTGEGSPLNTDHFIGWNSHNNDAFIIAPEFSSVVPPRQVDIYFHNNLAMGTGLPPIAVINVGYSNPLVNVGPILFTYANNQQLIESNNSTTMVSVVITTNYEAELITLPFTFFWLQFDFSSTPLNQALISEIKIFTEPGELYTHICNIMLLLPCLYNVYISLVTISICTYFFS